MWLELLFKVFINFISLHPISKIFFSLFLFKVLNKKFLKKLIALSDKCDAEVLFAYILLYRRFGEINFSNCK